MRIGNMALAGLLVAALGARAEEAKPRILPVDGGMSSRLADLGDSLVKGKDALRSQLTDTLDTSRKQAHEMIDKIIDSGGLEDWLEAMAKEKGDGLAQSLKGKDPEVVRTALHSRLDRRLSSLGKEISSGLEKASDADLKAAYQTAIGHLATEETSILDAAASADVETVQGPQNGEAPADAPTAPEGSPAAPWVTPAYTANPYGYGGQRGYNAVVMGAMPPSYQRTLNAVQQRAWFQGQLAAARWNGQVASFNTYLYGRRQPAYSNPRFRQCGFPAGYYYRPDRVERVVRRGLWGAAAVAATPFALVASLF